MTEDIGQHIDLNHTNQKQDTSSHSPSPSQTFSSAFHIAICAPEFWSLPKHSLHLNFVKDCSPFRISSDRSSRLRNLLNDLVPIQFRSLALMATPSTSSLEQGDHHPAPSNIAPCFGRCSMAIAQTGSML